ncbi:hypothetical protein PIROE2DRAFT_18109 [Piromyces sp. E2]|nr:hypothetical protein PIROE2DRAFT_18109 [Piromyces sp. E2]|eukprot:OUM57031.1 hypothetical protein PIROE2DRAFT_18109 [Piromyces sp. E2]
MVTRLKYFLGVIFYQKIVGSHDALPPEQRSVNIYLYMAYDPTILCTNSINYSINYVKYIISEEKYNQVLKYNKILQNTSIEFLICRNISNIIPDKCIGGIEERDTLDTLQYSTQYLNKTLPLYLSITCNELKIILNSKMEIKIVKFENLLDNNSIKEFYYGITQLSYTEILEILKYSLKNNLKNINIKNTSYASNKKRSITDFSNMIIYSDKEFEHWIPLKDTELKNLSTESLNKILDNIFNLIEDIKNKGYFNSKNDNFELEFRLRNKFSNLNFQRYITNENNILNEEKENNNINEKDNTLSTDNDHDIYKKYKNIEARLFNYIEKIKEKEITSEMNNQTEYIKKITLMTSNYFIFKVSLNLVDVIF